jgi:hypothetical protein
MQQQWSAVDNFMISSLIPDDDVLIRYWKTTNAPGYLNMMLRPIRGSFWRCSCA